MKKAAIFVFAIIMLSILAISQDDGIKEKRQYRIGTTNWAGWSFLHVAEEKGFWKELGLKVKVVHYPRGILIHDGMRAGEVDFSMTMAGMMLNEKNQRTITVLATTNWSHGGDKILFRKSVDVNKASGIPIGLYVEGPALKYFLDLYLKTINRKITDFQIVIMYPDEVAAMFKAGRLKGAILFDPYAHELEKFFPGTIKASSSDFKGCIREILYTFSDTLETIPEEDIVKILRGVIRANKWINDQANRVEFLRIINNETYKGYDPFSDKVLEKMISNVVIHPPGILLKENREGGELYKHLKKIFGFMAETGEIKHIPAISDYFNNKYILKALQQEGVN